LPPFLAGSLNIGLRQKPTFALAKAAARLFFTRKPKVRTLA
jgi:hypothetical protein